MISGGGSGHEPFCAGYIGETAMYVPMQKKIKTLADLRFNLGNEKKGISNIKRKCPPGDGMLTGGVAGSVFASPPTGSWDCSKTHLVKTSLAVFASQFNYEETIFSFHLGGDQGCC